ncbi:hypothetical protein N0B31_09200 [Salinirubellus salinus]|uniref:Uncharacterized protein n=1 Tax=Salinirubellus salinus TaxID=1364945 RepID=A0A9E7R776_9EURY|nr:hypothetical protein [Salinirubellus salinus]UWM56454.1 hypothetical protein N0B31_09200 [Salinirubellus salinus]
MNDEEPGFVTAADLRDAEAEAAQSPASGGTGGDGAGGQFHIPERPSRTYPRDGGVEYVGGTVFSLSPATDRGDEALADVVESVLSAGAYRWGDWFDLPMPLYLVHDDTTHDTFRVSVRDGRVRLHVLPETESAGLRAFFERLGEHGEWAVERRVEDAL